jgi:hypothetical protein
MNGAHFSGENTTVSRQSKTVRVPVIQKYPNSDQTLGLWTVDIDGGWYLKLPRTSPRSLGAIIIGNSDLSTPHVKSTKSKRSALKKKFTYELSIIEVKKSYPIRTIGNWLNVNFWDRGWQIEIKKSNLLCQPIKTSIIIIEFFLFLFCHCIRSYE